MDIGETFSVALSALRANKLRSMLTMLGIVIGVAAVIAMIALGNGAQKSIQDRISSLGTTLLTVQPGQLRGGGGGGIVQVDTRQRLTVDDAEALTDRGTQFTAVQPEMTRQFQVQYLNKNTTTRVVGTTANYLEVRKFKLKAGRMFTQGEDEARQRVAVIGPTVVTNLGLEVADALLGEPIRVRGIQFTVVGVLESKGQANAFNDPDDQILIPIQTARFRLMGQDRVNSISVLATSEEKIPDAMADIQKVLRREHKLKSSAPDDFQIRNQSDFLTTLNETSKTFGYLLAGIAAVSLLVGGIGIMNIMLVSVTERTREIGIRKALGATKINILLQFLIEAITLCLLGGLIGILLGAGGAWFLTKQFSWNADISISSVFLAFAFSAIVGVLFGVWPARRAASLDPIVALRYE
jgi:putative ABC transport system permease protein